MIPIIIAIVISAIGLRFYNAYKDDESDSKVKKIIATIGVLSPVIAILLVGSWAGFVEFAGYTHLKDDKTVITDEMISEFRNDNVTKEIIEKVKKHNEACEDYYNTYQSSFMWSVLGHFRDSALDLRVNIPEMILSKINKS